MKKSSSGYFKTRTKGSVKDIPVHFKLPQAHPKQFELIHAFELQGCRFVVGAAGTKFGKTYGCAIRLVKEAWENLNSLNWWVAPSYAQAKIAVDLVLDILPKDTYDFEKKDLKITLKDPEGNKRSVIEFKSGDVPGNLRGFAVNFFILDEASRMPMDSFVSIMTTVTRTMGRGIIISTPKGRNWFYDVYQRGNKDSLLAGEVDEYPEWYSIRMPTYANPFVTKESIRQMKQNLPDDVFEQEVEAKFLSDSAGVFKNIEHPRVKWGTFEPPKRGVSYVIGVDLARIRDYTVLTVGERSSNRAVHVERFNKISWELQYHRIIRLAKQFNNAVCVVDSTGIGDPIVEALISGGVNCFEYKIGGSVAKERLIEKLRINLEQFRISYPKEGPHILTMCKELASYEYEYGPSGNLKYSCPDSMNDDCVISLALMNWGADQPEFKYYYFSAPGI